jgi:hypothetical protein
MLQVFYLDVAKIDLDVAYIWKWFKCFHTYVASVFIRMLQVFSSRFAIFAMATHVFSSLFSVLQVF